MQSQSLALRQNKNTDKVAPAPLLIKLKGKQPRKSLASRHAAMTDKSGGLFACWTWQAAKASDGYGKIGANGKTRSAHIVAWELANGCAIPDSIRHTCNCPTCQNPAHMLLGTKAENSADMIAAGRQSKGRTPVATVMKIAKLALDGMKAPAIAAKIGINIVIVRNILRGATHSKITGIPRNRATGKGRDLAKLLGVDNLIVDRKTRKSGIVASATA